MRLADIFMAFPALLLALFIDATIKRPIADMVFNLYQETGYAILSNKVNLDYLIVFSSLALASWPLSGSPDSRANSLSSK